MPNANFDSRNRALIDTLTESRQLKPFYTINGPMGPVVNIEGHGDVLVLCSNNYLGLANHPEVVAAGLAGVEKYGAGTASVRFICGTFDCHLQIEKTIARFAGTESSLTYVSCWCANEALFQTLAGPNDIILSDQLNHASIIDGIRLVKRDTERAVYKHNDLDDLREKLIAARDKECRWIVTDGVFSMEGDTALLPELVDLSREHDALLVVDDSHGAGVLGETGRGTPELCGVLGEVDIITGTLGKALGGGAGGYIAASQSVVDVLLQRSRPSLFSNALPATIACSGRCAIELVEEDPGIVQRLRDNTTAIRKGLADLGFDCPPSPTAIIPIMIGDAADAIAKSKKLLEMGVLVIGFSFPVVPKGAARLRVQSSAALEPQHIEQILDAFGKL